MRKQDFEKSRETLALLLRSNFWEGAQLLTLTYRGGIVPSRLLASLQLENWLRTIRRKWGPVPYIRATEYPNRPGTYPHHKVIMGTDCPPVALLETSWSYGFIITRPLIRTDLELITEQIMGTAGRDLDNHPTGKRIWTASSGLSRK